MSHPFRQEDSSSELPAEPPGLKTWQTVHVRNTFIEVDESTEARADPAVPSLSSGSTLGRTWRRGHLRCASEPMSSVFARSPWEPMSLATSPLDALPSAALEPDSLGTMLDQSSGHGPANPERGRVSTSLGATLMRSPRAHSYVSPIRETDEYEALRQFHFPKYIDINPDFMGQRPWRGEPMMVDVLPSTNLDSQERKEAYHARHTLAVPVRSFRHARQRSRTIQEDKELVDTQTLHGLVEDVQPHLASQSSWDNFGNVNFRVRNTFIEVDETGSEGCADLLSPPRWRPSHLRCASEPVQSFEGLQNSLHSGHSGFHSRTSSYQADEPSLEHIAEVLQQAQKAQALPEEPQEAPPGLTPGLGLRGQEASQAERAERDREQWRWTDRTWLETSQPEPSQREGTSTPVTVKTLQCKWHVRGTCKYGAACRFSHDLPRTAQKKPASSPSNECLQRCTTSSGPLPAGGRTFADASKTLRGNALLSMAGLVPGPLPVGPNGSKAGLHCCLYLLILSSAPPLVALSCSSSYCDVLACDIMRWHTVPAKCRHMMAQFCPIRYAECLSLQVAAEVPQTPGPVPRHTFRAVSLSMPGHVA